MQKYSAGIESHKPSRYVGRLAVDRWLLRQSSPKVISKMAGRGCELQATDTSSLLAENENVSGKSNVPVSFLFEFWVNLIVPWYAAVVVPWAILVLSE